MNLNLAEYYLLYGDDGLEKLAAGAGTKVSYLRQLMYLPTIKEPSLTKAARLVKASGGKLSFERLCKEAQVDHRVLRRPKSSSSGEAAP